MPNSSAAPLPTARSHLGALIDSAPEDLAGAYAIVLEELDALCADGPLQPADPVAARSRPDLYSQARSAIEALAAGLPNRLGYELCLARLDATWDAELARSGR